MLDMTTPGDLGSVDQWQKRVETRSLQGHPKQRYLIYRPQSLDEHAPLAIAVHGISRNGKEQIEQFRSWADRYQTAILAPLFIKPVFKDYQRLGRAGRGERADLALLQMIDEATAALRIRKQPVYLFGYSGGGQFAHRFAMAHPQQVARIAIGAAGWYTYPDPTRKFPHGVLDTEALPGVTFEPAAFLRIPALVMVGELDKERDASLNRSLHIDRRQGATRIARGRRWVEAMRQAAAAFGYETDYRFVMLPDSGHSFLENMQKGNMGKHVFQFFFGQDIEEVK